MSGGIGICTRRGRVRISNRRGRLGAEVVPVHTLNLDLESSVVPVSIPCCCCCAGYMFASPKREVRGRAAVLD